MAHEFPILPSTKVAELLDHYPELEAVLIALAPPFQKLKNPLLRKGVAKVASLKHAATVAGLPINNLVNKLRAAVGQEPIISGDSSESITYFSRQPAWFDSERIVKSIDERSADPNIVPVVSVLQAAAHLHVGEILELVTSFLPAPGIDVMKKKGLRVWSVQERPDLIRTFIARGTKVTGIGNPDMGQHLEIE